MDRNAALVVILVLAAGLRLYGFDWGTDTETGKFYRFHPDEATLVDGAGWIGRDLREIKASYGKAPMYLLSVVAHVAGSALGVIPFATEDAASMRFTHLVGRAMSAIFGTITVWVVFCIGRRLKDEWTGVLSAGFLAVCAGHIQQSHYYTVDVFLAFWVTLGVYLILRMPSESRWLYLIFGLVCGIGAGTRLVGVWLGIPFVVAHLWPGNGRIALRNLLNPRVGIAFLVAAITALGCEPLLILDPDYFFSTDDVRRLLPSLDVANGEAVRIWTLYDFSTTPYLYYVTHLFRYAMGTPLEIVCLVGLFTAIWKREKAGWVILGWLVPYFLLVGGLFTKPIRYTTPMVPLMVVLGAWACLEGAIWAHRRWQWRPILALPVLVIALPAALYGFGVTRIYGNEDSRITAARWVASPIPQGDQVLVEVGGFPTRWMVPEDRYHVKLDQPSYFINVEGCFPYAVQVGFVETMLEDVDWIVVIEENRMKQFLATGDEYPIGYEYYHRLGTGHLGFERVARLKSSPGLLSWSFSEEDAEPTITAFDHPTVSVFRRTSEALSGVVQEWKKEVLQNPQLPDRDFEVGKSAYLKGKWNSALVAFRRVTSLRPDFLLRHLMQVNTLIRKGEEARAKEIWEDVDARFGGIPVEVGVGLVRAGLIEDGVAYLERSVSLFEMAGKVPGWVVQAAAEARFELASKLYEREDFSSAETEYRRAIELASDFVSPHVGLGTLYLDQHRYNDALPALKRALKLDGSHADTWFLLAKVHHALENLDEARQAIQQAMSLQPDQENYESECLALQLQN